MKVFNLAQYLVREAMGYTRQENRDPYEWWDYEQLVGGGNEQWNHWVSVDGSLSDVLDDCADFRHKTFRTLRAMYGMTDDQLKNIWKTYVGYHPAYGAYICSIGPYIGTKFVGEAQDKFAYFIIRKRKSSQDEVAESVAKNIESYMEMYNVQLEPGDIQLVVKAPTTDFDPNKKKQKNKEVREIVTSMDPNDPVTQDFFQRAPIVSEGSHFGLNARGLEKVIRRMWGPLYERSLAEKARAEGISIEVARSRQLQDLGFLKSVYEGVQRAYQQAATSGAAALQGMSPPPRFLDLSLPSKSGSVQFRTLPTNKLQARQLVLKQEILQLMSQGLNTPEEIRNRLNMEESRVRKSRLISLEDVQDRVGEIRQQIAQRKAANPQVEDAALHQQMIGETASQSVALESERGFNDLKTAFDMAKLYFTNLPVDPKSKSKDMAALKYAPTMAFDPPENFQNVTTEELRDIRLEYEARRRGQGQAPGAEISDAELEKQIGPREQEEPVKEEVAEEKPTTTVPETLENPEETESAPISRPRSHKKLFASTLGSLMKIAEELDKEGKCSEAEEIHKVIRKYEEEI